ncbi:MAG: hypothetical protein KatS3mg110_4614 [Pirellulaceae bacterium]|nr:MAG: hypothetical protein KatS3mg110_4614 [Pirellulaceae bacterium]
MSHMVAAWETFRGVVAESGEPMARIVILTEGHTNPHTGKTAAGVIRYRRPEVVAVLDKTQAGRRASELLGVGDDVPIVGSLDDVPDADTLLIGIAPPGGKVPEAWRPIILQALERGMHLVSGLHDFLSNDEEFARVAREHGATIYDVRKNREKTIARRRGIRPDCLRVHTVGHDCSVGKMLAAVEITRGLKQRGVDAKFIATGQTGIMIEGDGAPIDCVVADFVSGAVEKLILEHQHHEVLVIEGQGSLVHPSYSGVTLALLHGCLPHALVLCYEVGRTRVTGVEHVPIPPLAEIKRLNETMAGIFMPTRVIAVAMNSSKVSAEEAERERRHVRATLGVPVCDVVRHGPDELVQAVLTFRDTVPWRCWGVQAALPPEPTAATPIDPRD